MRRRPGGCGKMKLPLSRIADFLAAAGEFDPQAEALAYSIDSRTIQRGRSLLRGEGRAPRRARLRRGSSREGRGGRRRPQRSDGALSCGHAGSGRRRHSACLADARHRRSPSVGETADRHHRISRQNHHQGSHRPRAFLALSCAQVGRKLQQSFRTAADAA